MFILKSEEALKKAKALSPFIFNAPVVLLFCADDERVWRSSVDKGYDSGEADVNIVATHIMLAAWDMGIGSVWVRGFNGEQVRKAYKLPENIRPICMMPIGYPSETCKPHRLHYEYRDMREWVEEM